MSSRSRHVNWFCRRLIVCNEGVTFVCVWLQAARRYRDGRVGERGVSPVCRAGAVHAHRQSHHPCPAAGSAHLHQCHAAGGGNLHLHTASRAPHRHGNA